MVHKHPLVQISWRGKRHARADQTLPAIERHRHMVRVCTRRQTPIPLPAKNARSKRSGVSPYTTHAGSVRDRHPPAYGHVHHPADLSLEGRPRAKILTDSGGRPGFPAHGWGNSTPGIALNHSPSYSCGTAPDSIASAFGCTAIPPASRFKPWLPSLRAPLLGQLFYCESLKPRTAF
jgi:hypothetical protein